MPGAVGSTAVAEAQTPVLLHSVLCQGSGGRSALVPLHSAQAVVSEMPSLRGSAAGCW